MKRQNKKVYKRNCLYYYAFRMVENKFQNGLREVIDMTIDEITEKIIESKNNDIAKAFTMHIGSLLINNDIVPIMTEYTRDDVKNITDTNEYKLVMEYGISFKELDCSKHDNEIYKKAIDDFVKLVKKYDWSIRNRNENAFIYGAIDKIAEQLKAGRKNDGE